jgi:GTP-binding protein EngB required for normal cell division
MSQLHLKYKCSKEEFDVVRKFIVDAIESLNVSTMLDAEIIQHCKKKVVWRIHKIPCLHNANLTELIKDIFEEYKNAKPPLIMRTAKFGAIELNIEEKDTDTWVRTDPDTDKDKKEEEENSRIPADNVNLCFVGGVSTGKSTILNAIFCEQLTQCKIKRTTMVPTIYIENENNPFQVSEPEDIYKQIAEKNAELIRKTENGEKISKKEYSELVFNVGKLDINILPDAYVNVYDIPGLNDARTKDIYYEYLADHFHKFNLLIFIVDIHSGLNTSDEIDIVNFISRNTRDQLDKNKKRIYTMVIVNKADDMQLDEDSEEADKLCLTGELSEMYDQVEKTIRIEFDRQNVADHLIGIIPLCAIDAYLYRMVKKHGTGFKLTPEQILKIGVNENGKKFSTLKPAVQEKKVYDILNDGTFIDTMIKLSGFSFLEKMLSKFLSENDTGKTIRVHNLLFNLRKHEDIVDYLFRADSLSPEGFWQLVEKHDKVYQSIRKIDPQMYDGFMTDIVARLQTTIEHKLKSCYRYETISELLEDYRHLEQNVLDVYYSEYYDTNDFPVSVKEYVYNLILEHNQNKFCADMPDLIVDIRRLEAVKFYNTITVSTLLHVFTQKEIMTTYQIKYDALLTFFDELQQLRVDITKLLRYLILHDINACLGMKDDLLFCRKMLYQRYNELPIQNYLLLQMHKLRVSDEVVLKGLVEDDVLACEDLKIDVYYLRYKHFME